jgi:glycosyltransferase involved in cell wall biosynthesis
MSEKPSIIFVNQATGYLTIDIINAFVASDHFSKVALLAGSIRVQDVPLSAEVEWNKVTLYDRGNPRKKFISWLLGSLQIGWRLATKYRSYEVFYITIPPFAYLWSLILPNRFSILVFDVYPDVLKIYNIRKTNLLYRMWSWSNKRIFKKAHRLYTLGEGMVQLLTQYIERNKITIIPNWSGLLNIKEVPRSENIFSREHDLQNKFVVQYSGNIGYTHNVEILVELARLMQMHANLFFLIIGRGERYATIQKKIETEQLMNCKILPFQPDDMLNFTLSTADLGVVLLDDKTAHVSIPSKIYNLQSVGVPILGIADTASELANHLKKHKNGECFNQKNLDQIIDFILQLMNAPEKLQALKLNSRMAANDYTLSNANKYVIMYVS